MKIIQNLTDKCFINEQIKVIDNQNKDINDKEILPSKDNLFMSNSDNQML